MKGEVKPEKDKCVMCGKETPYFVTTHIDLRIGYIEGGGQGCFQPLTCDNLRSGLAGLFGGQEFSNDEKKLSNN